MLIITQVLRDIIEQRPPLDAVATCARSYLNEPRADELRRLRKTCAPAEAAAIDAALGPAGERTPLACLLDETWSIGLDRQLLAMPLNTACASDCWKLILRADDVMADLNDVSEGDRRAMLRCIKSQIEVLFAG